ncbi:BEN domain-containing protein 5 [Ixodes scapularis]|uniref:BEN domain-containing protein 5 n=1 Tax=Ixodes scapularis TaxID=6945 RepID=UPI001A9F6D95|nr:BEN domain-containing protein 5 [Ixodes scapularis]
MFALVRFPNEFGDKVYVVPTVNIKDFYPSGDTDFDPGAVYQAFWKDPAGANTGFYSAQILVMAETEEGLEEKRSAKRLRKAKVYASEYEAEEDADEPVPSSAVARKERQEKKTRKGNQQAAKGSAYAEILREQIESSKRKNAEAAGHLDAQAPKKKRLEITSESDTDDSLVVPPLSQLQLKQQDARHWHQRYKEEHKENARLHGIIASMQSCIDEKLDTIQQLLEAQVQAPPTEIFKPSHDFAPRGSPSSKAPDTADVIMEASTSFAISKTVPANGATVGASARTKLSNPTSQRRPLSTDVAEYSGPRSAPPFSTLDSGRFHLKGGVTIREDQRQTIFNNTRAAKVAKDTAQALWGSEKLSQRTYGGRLAPKDRRNPGAIARKELSPEKVALVFETVTYWGQTKKVDVSSALVNMNTILSEKIQDTRKALKRIDLSKSVQT